MKNIAFFEVDQSSEKQHLDYADSMVRTGGRFKYSMGSSVRHTKEVHLTPLDFLGLVQKYG